MTGGNMYDSFGRQISNFAWVSIVFVYKSKSKTIRYTKLPAIRSTPNVILRIMHNYFWFLACVLQYHISRVRHGLAFGFHCTLGAARLSLARLSIRRGLAYSTHAE